MVLTIVSTRFLSKYALNKMGHLFSCWHGLIFYRGDSTFKDMEKMITDSQRDEFSFPVREIP
jgi:hypothetical protein